MRIISAIPRLIPAQVPGRPPLVNGPTETVFPRRCVNIPFATVIELPEKEGRHVLARYAKGGMLEVKEGQDPDAVLFEAKQIRYRHLMQMIEEYKREQATRQGRGDAVLLPGPHLQRYLAEAKRLQKEVVEENPVLAADLPKLPEDRGKPEPDPMATELERYGIPSEASPLTPGIKTPISLEF